MRKLKMVRDRQTVTFPSGSPVVRHISSDPIHGSDLSIVTPAVRHKGSRQGLSSPCSTMQTVPNTQYCWQQQHRGCSYKSYLTVNGYCGGGCHMAQGKALYHWRL